MPDLLNGGVSSPGQIPQDALNVPEPQGGQRTPDDPKTPSDVVWGDDVKSALLEITRMAAREYEGPWKSHFREFIEAEEFWKGNHYPVWYERDFNWRTPFEFALENNRLEDMPTYQYAINLYQALGLTAISKLSESIPKARWFPQSPSSEIDMATARAASKAAMHIEENNKVKMMASRKAYLSWTQGIFATRIRFVRDKRYGVTQQPIIESSTVQVAPDRHICDSCGEETPAAESQEQQLQPELRDQEGVEDQGGPQCQGCGAQMSDANFAPAEHAEVPIVSEIKDVPNGQEKLSIYGGTNVVVMPYVNEFEDSGYLILQEEVSFASVRATWPDTARNIGPNESDAYGNTSDTDAYSKNARMRMMDAAQPFGNQRSYAGSAKSFSTVKQCFFRPWYLYSVSNIDMRNKLIEAFPDGCYVAFADGAFLEAENRNIDDEWNLCYPMPGQGLYRPSLGSSTIPINKQLDDGANLVAEHLDFGSAPPMFYDAMQISGTGLQENPMRPGMYVPVMRQNGGMAKNLSELFHQPTFRLDPNVYGYGKSLIEVGQIVSGIMPSMFGGPLKGNETLGAYQMSAAQAMGKLNLFWKAFQQDHAEVMTKAVKCFSKNRTEDVELAIMDASQQIAADFIRIDDMQGNVIARVSSDADFPATMEEIRANIMELVQKVPTVASELLSNPANFPIVKRVLASDEFTMTSESQREKMYREISDILVTPPMEVPQQDPMTGMVTMQPVCTVPPNIWVDDHQVCVATIQEFCRSDKGIEQEHTNPAGYANLMARLLEEFDAMAAVQAKMAGIAAAGIPPALPGTPGAAPPGGGGAPAGGPPKG